MAHVTMRVTFTWVLLVGVCLNAAGINAWGTYLCDIQDKGLKKIGEVCSGVATATQPPLSALEEKLERVLAFVEEIKNAEDSPLQASRKSSTVERDLSGREETDRRDSDMETQDRERSRQEDRDSRDRRDYERTRIDEDRRDRGRNGTYGDWRDGEMDRDERRDGGMDRDGRRDGGMDRDGRRDGGMDRDEWRDRSVDRRNWEWRSSRRERTSDDERRDDRERQRQGREERRTGDKEERTQRGEDYVEVGIRRKRPQDKEDENDPKKGECKSITIDNHETIGMFFMNSFQHGHCANRNPIVEPIRYCLGYCATKTFIDRESGLWSQGSDCKSCQPLRFETLKIPLSCDDGFSFEKKFKNVVDCQCKRCQSTTESPKGQ